MTAPSSGPPLPKSRGLALFDRQAAKINPHDDETSSQPTLHDNNTRSFPAPLKPLQSFASPAAPVSSVLHHHHQAYSPIALPRRLPSQSPESYPHSSNENVQLLRIQPRPELTYIKELPAKTLPTKQQEKFLETDFPLIDNSNNADREETVDSSSLPIDTAYVDQVEQEFSYLHSYDGDDDDDVIHRADDYPHQDYSSDSFDDDHHHHRDEDESSAEILERSAAHAVTEHHSRKFFIFCVFSSVFWSS